MYFIVVADYRPVRDQDVQCQHVPARGRVLLYLSERLRAVAESESVAVRAPFPQRLRGRVAAGEFHVPDMPQVHLRPSRATRDCHCD